MKNDDQMFQSVLSRRDEYRERRKKRILTIKHTVPVLACFCLCAVLGLGYRNHFGNKPSIPVQPDGIDEPTLEAHETTTQTQIDNQTEPVFTTAPTFRDETEHITTTASIQTQTGTWILTTPPSVTETTAASFTTISDSFTTDTQVYSSITNTYKTEEMTTVTNNTTVTPEPNTIPLWKGDVLIASSTCAEPPELACWFRFFPHEQYEMMREEFSIPQNVDLSQQPCLLITVLTGYANTAIFGCQYTKDGLIMKIAYLETDTFVEQTMRYAIPIPDYLSLTPDNCVAEFITITNESEYQALLTDTLCMESVE